MKISIAICTYNGEKFLSEQLESFAQQSRLPDELVVCDDCSTDHTLEILQDFAKKSPFEVKIFVNESNLGVTKNFEKTISLCTGDIIFLSDQDDFWMPEKIEVIENEFKKSPTVGLIFTNAELVDENLNLLNGYLWDYTFSKQDQINFKRGNEFEILIRFTTITGATMAFRSELTKICFSIPIINGVLHDGWISLIACLFFEIVPLKISLIKYRQHSNQQIGVSRNKVESLSNNLEKSRNQLYNDVINDCLELKEQVLRVKNACEETLKSVSNGNRLKLINDPYLICDRLISKMEQTILHISIRENMPSNRVNRIPKILSELIMGNYHKFSRGFRSAIIDFFKIKDE